MWGREAHAAGRLDVLIADQERESVIVEFKEVYLKDVMTNLIRLVPTILSQ